MSLQPHGGILVQSYLPEESYKNIQHEIPLDEIALSDLELIAIGAYSPIEGFLARGRLSERCGIITARDGSVWSIPITLPIEKEKADHLRREKEQACL